VLNPIHVGIGLVERAEGVDVFVGDVANRPGGHEVQQVGLVDTLGVGLLLNQSAFLLKPVPEGCVG
jgi:hypothetical protein